MSTRTAAAFAVNTYPFAARLPLEPCLNHLADQGYRTFEVMLISGHYWPSLDEGGRERQRIAALLAARGLRILTLNQPNLDINLASAVPEMRAYTCNVVIEAMRLGADWGAKGVVVNPGKANPMLPADEGALRDHFRRSLDVLVPASRDTGVEILVKNHPLSFLYTVPDLLGFFDVYGWDQIAIGYDVANGAFGREEPHTALTALGARLRLVYAADTPLDTFRHLTVGKGTVPFGKISETLRAIGYAGATVLEILDGDADHSLAASVRALTAVGWPGSADA